ncbi:MAG: putative sulfate exporter family transporter [Acetobacteraceae bacterium]|nr:putative sulfate exporter family transporter [Acetobacteraceae bacterium]
MFRHKLVEPAPGLLLCIAVSAGATMLERLQVPAFGRVWLEALVMAILLGALVRTFWSPGARWISGVKFSAHTLLEIAVVLLGASVSMQTILAAGPWLLGGIAAVVLMAISVGYGVGRSLGLPHRMATLVACGNSICGNSAIAAVSTIIGADGEEISSSIAFTAVLGVVVVLILPPLARMWHLSGLQYGVLSGLTVYAVPQVLAATAPLGPVAVQMGTLVKLVRVLMLGPVVLGLTLLARRSRDEPDASWPHVTAGNRPKPGRLPVHKLVPWYIAGFLVLAGARSLDLVPHPALGPIAFAVNVLTVISMAALGLGTDIRAVARAGASVTLTVALSLLILAAISFGLIRLLHIA